MINIRPVSDLRNKYTEIEDLILKEDSAVYLTKNGYGTMVVLSLEKYSKMIEELQIEESLAERFGSVDIKKELEEAEKEADYPNTKYYSHEEVFDSLRRIINGAK